MDKSLVGWLSIPVFFVLAALGIPVAVVLAIVAIVGFAIIGGFEPSLSLAGMVLYAKTATYTFSVLPMFILMGNIAFYSGFARDFFDAASKWVGGLKMGIAYAAMIAYAIFSAASGSSIAACATMAKILAPEFERAGYNKRLAFGVITAGATLDPLIPPSLLMVIYGIIAGESIAKLLIAGIMPGLTLAGIFMLLIFIMGRINPKLVGLSNPVVTWKARFSSLGNVWPIVAIIVVALGGIYTGVFTPTEGGAVGAFAALVLALVSRRMGVKQLQESLIDTIKTTSSIFIIIATAFVFAHFIAVTRLPYQVSEFMASLQVPRLAILTGIIIFYLILGCLMDMIAAMFITLPILLPSIISLGYHPIWFGVIMVQLCVIALLTPPYGLNLFTIKAVLPSAEMKDIIWGTLPFVGASIANLWLLVAFPQIALFLPSFMD